jgi:NADH-quinone oxidoreductase subunit C
VEQFVAGDIAEIVAAEVGIQLAIDASGSHPTTQLAVEQLVPVMRVLHRHPQLYFDMLESISGVDYHPREASLGVVYHLYSVLAGRWLVVKVKVPRPEVPTALSEPVPSVSEIWRTAEWHEREVFDFFGIPFGQHPDLRRMFLPADWEGFPLRKDYTEAEEYHGMAIK